MLDEIFKLEKQPYSQSDAEWDAFVEGHPMGSVLQTTRWAQLKNHFGWRSHRVWLRQEGKLVAGAQVLFRSALLGMVRMAYIPHGPLVNWQDEEQVAVMMNQIDLSCYEHRAGLLKMEPLVWEIGGLETGEWETGGLETGGLEIGEGGWVTGMSRRRWVEICEAQELVVKTDTIQPPRTLLVDLRPSEEEILQRMKQKTRYNIRLAQRKGVVVREGTLEDMATFNSLMQVTGQRDGFGIHQPQYYRTAYELFAPERAAMLLAEYEGKALAALMVFATGQRAAYLYGASSDEERQRMPAYALQWEAMRWAKQRGCTTYDLWGVPDYDEETLEAQFTERNDGLWGVYRFKRGFGGELVRTVGAADRVHNKMLYKLYKWRRGAS